MSPDEAASWPLESEAKAEFQPCLGYLARLWLKFKPLSASQEAFGECTLPGPQKMLH